MAADAFITCRVTAETKALVRRLAERGGIHESALVKQLLDVVLRASAAEERLAPPAPDKVARHALYVRLEAEDWRLLRERATARGMASATYLALLARSHPCSVIPLPKAEYLALRETVLELTAMGRNLNQIARVLNEGGRPAPPGRAEFTAMLKPPEGSRDHIRALLRATERSWRQGHAEMSR